MKNLTINYSIESSAGTKAKNEDAAWIGFNKSKQWLAIVCDGIGSERNSEIASTSVIDSFKKKFLKKKKINFPLFWFKRTLNYSYKKLKKTINNMNIKSHVGTTIVLCIISNDKVYVFHIGDSRLYHHKINSYEWTLLTRDHNLINFLDTIKTHQLPTLIQNKNMLFSLTQYIHSSSKKKMHFDFKKIRINPNDLLFLSSDGLYNYINVDKSLTLFIANNRGENFKSICNKLIKTAIKNGSNDNLTGILISFSYQK